MVFFPGILQIPGIAELKILPGGGSLRVVGEKNPKKNHKNQVKT